MPFCARLVSKQRRQFEKAVDKKGHPMKKRLIEYDLSMADISGPLALVWRE
jgi:hypothetical protein